jgi:hypothetical protein
VTLLLSVDDQTVVSTSIVSLRLTIFAFSAEEIQIVATEDLLMNAQIRRTEPYPGVLKRVHSSTIEKSMIGLQLFIGPLPKLHNRRLAEVAISELSNGVLGRQTLGCWLVCLSDSQSVCLFAMFGRKSVSYPRVGAPNAPFSC